MAVYPASAQERAMKIEQVILRALSKQITFWQAAHIARISPRHLRRLYERYRRYGFDGLYDRRKGRPSPKRVPLAVVEQVLCLYREKYFDFSVRHFHEKLGEEHGIDYSYTWVKRLLQEAGLVAQTRKRGPHRRKRERRPMTGMLLHIDASKHRWLGGEQRHDLLVILDDATSEIYYAQLVEEESTASALAAQSESAFVPVTGKDLDRIFSVQQERVVNQDNTVRIANHTLQIERTKWRGTLAKCHVLVCEHLDGTWSVFYGPHQVGRYAQDGSRYRSAESTFTGRGNPAPPAGFPLPPTATPAEGENTRTGQITC